jgi:hypothetical protein
MYAADASNDRTGKGDQNSRAETPVKTFGHFYGKAGVNARIRRRLPRHFIQAQHAASLFDRAEITVRRIFS